MTYERQAMVSLLRSPGMVFYDGGSDKCALLRTVANQIETDGNRIEALEAEVERLEALFTNATYEARAMMEEIERLRAELSGWREMAGKAEQ